VKSSSRYVNNVLTDLYISRSFDVLAFTLDFFKTPALSSYFLCEENRWLSASGRDDKSETEMNDSWIDSIELQCLMKCRFLSSVKFLLSNNGQGIMCIG